MAQNFNTEPYFDDYNAEKEFYRILFRPSYAVQARELTQIQTILQNQVSRFGDHVFKNGSQVIPGSVNVDNQVHFIKLELFYGTEDVTTYINTFKNKIITGNQSGVKMRVLDTSADTSYIVDNLTTPTLYCKIESIGNYDGNGVQYTRLVAGETITATVEDNQITTNFRLKENQLEPIDATVRLTGDGVAATSYTGNPASDVLGYAYAVDVKQGVYYIDGFFVRNPDLRLYVGRFQPDPTCRVGFKVTETAVTPEDDETILDNATGSYNFAAPGAHRYKISLSLVKLPLLSTDNIKFIELVRIVDGRVQQKIETASYAELEKTLARRTYDESGNYEVNKFKLSVREHLDNGSNFGVYPAAPEIPLEGVTYGDENKFVMVVDPGKAYIQGYEVESIASQFISFDKARIIDGEENNHIARVDQQPIGLTNGNYTKVTNVYKFPNITTFEKVYLVNTPNATPGAAPVAANIIGTARVRSIQLDSGDYTGGTATVYKLGLMDIQMYSGYSFEVDVKQITGQNGSTNFTCDISPQLVYIPNASATTASTSSPTVSVAGASLTGLLKAGDIIYINDTKVGVVSTFTNLSITLTANALVAITGGTLSHAHAQLIEPSYNTLLFPVGYNTIKTLRGQSVLGLDTDQNTTTVVRRYFTKSTGAAETILSFSVTAGVESFLSDDDLSNFLLINGTTNRPVNITAASIEFGSVARTTVTFSGLSNSTTYYLIASVRQVSTAAQEKVKELNSSPHYDTIVSKKSVSGQVIELTKADALRLVSVHMTPGDYDTFDPDTAIDVTDRYRLDNGQRDTYYTNAKIVLNPGYQPSSGALRVTYDYFTVKAAFGNYFSVDSYIDMDDYDSIPSYSITNPTTGKKTEVSLADVIDFRPILGGDNTFYPEIPKIGEDIVAPVVYYMGRKDKISLDSVGRFNVIKGVPSIDPQEPEDPKEGMVLATVSIPPYTKNVSDVAIKQRDNRRYTMKDIGKLEKRISNLEYYVSLSLLEKDTATMQIKDDYGLDKYKNGFLVDQFTGHGVGDVKNQDYKIAVDSENKVLRPMHHTVALEIVEDLSSGSARLTKSYKKSGDLVTLPYTESTFIFNNNATRSMDITALSIGAFRGQVTLYPEGDNWKDTERRPDLTVTDDNNYDAIKYLAAELGVTGTKWNEWQTNWTSVVPTSTNTWESQSGNTVTGYESTIYEWSGIKSRNGVTTSLTSSVNSQDYGDRIVDISYIPYMRARPVSFIAKNLKANTNFWAFFDGTPVAEYIKPADKFKVERVSAANQFSFDLVDMQDNILADQVARADGSVIQPAFSIGDVVTNETHAGTNITAIGNLSAPAATFTVTVASAAGILPGHHVVLYNLDNHNAKNQKTLEDLQENQIIPASTGVTNNAATSKQLNLRKFKVVSMSGSIITLGNIDGTNVSAFDAYNTDSYSGGARGRLLRLKASAVIAYDGDVTEFAEDGSFVSQEIFAINVKNGFGVGESLRGSVNIGTTSNTNSVKLVAINDSTSLVVAPPMKKLGDDLLTDVTGAAVGVFYLPNNDTLAFRTGERTFKLIDNISNSDAAFDSIGDTVYYSQGITLTKERTIVSSRTAEFVKDGVYEELKTRRSTTSTRQLYSFNVGGDPLAQTFTISSTGGCFVTSIDLFFATFGTRPVTLEIRTTNNGVPSTKIVPFSSVTLTKQQVNVSTTSSVPTTIKFQAPIYLQDGETYCFVLLTDEPGTKVYVSELGKTDLLTSNIISAQPLTGSLYASQNAKEWEINPLLDIKFVLRKAVFDIDSSAEVLLKAAPAPTMTLGTNPIQITKNSNLIRITAPNHGFLAGETVVISDVGPGFYGTNDATLGIPDTLLNGSHVISDLGHETHTFVIELVTTDSAENSLLSGTTADFINGEYGNNGIKISRSLSVDSLFVKTSDLNFQDTRIEYYIDIEDETGNFSGDMPIVANANYMFSSRKHICSYENQTVISENPLLKKSSLTIKGVLTSINANVSPVIDLQKISGYITSNLIDDDTAADVNVTEIDSITLLDFDSLAEVDLISTGTGTITATTGSTSVTGVGTLFTTQVVAGQVLKNSAGVTIGTVAAGGVVSNTSITLTANAAVAVTGAEFKIVGTPTLSFSNVGGLGTISATIDAADNLLANADIGKTIIISNAHANVNGTYVITNVVVAEDKNSSTNAVAYAGNPELDKIVITLDTAFAGSATIDMIADNDFSIVMLNKYVSDIAPVGVTSYANYITRPLSLTLEANEIKIMFDASIPTNTGIKVYYRVWNGNADLRKLPYIDTGFVNGSADTFNTYKERTIDITDVTSFSNLQIKLVMTASNPTIVPMVKNLRLLALTV